LSEPLQVRREQLRTHFKEVPGQFHFAQYKDTSDTAEIEAFMKLAIESSCEGLMVKSLTQEANYVPAKRNWLKVISPLSPSQYYQIRIIDAMMSMNRSRRITLLAVIHLIWCPSVHGLVKENVMVSMAHSCLVLFAPHLLFGCRHAQHNVDMIWWWYGGMV
jgi:hypothetical protein